MHGLIEKLQNYIMTASDLSDEFLHRCMKKYPDVPFIKLYAVSINTNKVFDCIFSKKVSLLFDITEKEPDVMTFMLYVKHREFLPNERPVCSSEPFEMMRSIVHRGMQQGDVLVVSSCLFGGAIRMITASLDGLLDKPLKTDLNEVWKYS